MAALLPERIEALLAPDRVELRRAGDCRTLAVPADVELPAWRAALAALDAALAAVPPRRPRLPHALAAPFAPRLDIVLSEHLSRWLLLPWQAEVASAGEREALARHRLREAYGEAARHWRVACAERPPGEAAPACAIDGELLVALHELAAAHGCRLARLRPLFGAAADRWRQRLPRGVAWFGVLEPGRLSLGLLRDHRWLAVHGASLSAGEAGEALAGLMARSALAHGLDRDAGHLLLCGDDADRCPAPPGYAAVSRLGAALPWLTSAAVARAAG